LQVVLFCVVSVLSVYTCTFVIVLFVVLHLQADNGGEFHGAAYSAKEEANVTVGGIIQELRQLWPGCRMVKGAPFHSATNGGVERFNRTIQEKIKMWMLHNSSGHWSIGARGMCIFFVHNHLTTKFLYIGRMVYL
jgi:hypothetical protein